mmetsp:Transcript_31521/g.89492  ORF Transcript_31521/g.89492 Transcript_31521/m.89492 type:complete len:351 (+) Transcript_31521:77-1129(+)
MLALLGGMRAAGRKWRLSINGLSGSPPPQVLVSNCVSLQWALPTSQALAGGSLHASDFPRVLEPARSFSNRPPIHHPERHGGGWKPGEASLEREIRSCRSGWDLEDFCRDRHRWFEPHESAAALTHLADLIKAGDASPVETSGVLGYLWDKTDKACDWLDREVELAATAEALRRLLTDYHALLSGRIVGNALLKLAAMGTGLDDPPGASEARHRLLKLVRRDAAVYHSPDLAAVARAMSGLHEQRHQRLKSLQNAGRPLPESEQLRSSLLDEESAAEVLAVQVAVRAQQLRPQDLVDVVGLLPHNSHFSQPLDVGVMQPLKCSYTKVAEACMDRTGCKELKEADAIKLPC